MKKLFTFAAALLFAMGAMAAEPTVSIVAKTATIADWGQTYNAGGPNEVTFSTVGAAYADKKPCGATTSEKAFSISSADGQWLEISAPNGLDSILLRGSGNSTGTTTYGAPICVSTSAPFDSTITSIITYKYTGYDQACEDQMIRLPEGTKSIRLYRRMKVNSTSTAVGSGSNWAPASGISGNQTLNLTYVEVYATTAAPMLSAFTVAGVQATIDQATKTVTAELPYGTDAAAAIAAATITLGGTATGSTISGNTITITDGTVNVDYTLNITVSTVHYVTVRFLDGENQLSESEIIAGETVAQPTAPTKAHYTFDGWFEDAAFTTPADFAAAINADKTFYAKWTAEAFNASTSINIEQLVLDNSKAYNITAALTAAHIAYANIDALDSLDASKTAGNEPYLGLKLKTAGAYVEVALNAGSVLRVKFGNVAADVKVNGTTVAKANLATPYEYTAAAQEYVRIETTTSGTVVLKQIMINEPIATVVLPGQEADKNVKLAALTLNGDTIEGFVADKKTYTIELPAGTATAPTVAATTADANATAVVNQAAAVPGDATVVVTAADGTTTATYTVHFVLPRAIEYLQAPYDVTNADFSTLPNWLHGNVVYNANYQGKDTTYCGHQVLRTITNTDPIHFYVGACDSLIITVSATGGRNAQLAIGDSIYATTAVKTGAAYKVAAYVHSEAAENHVVFSTPDANGGITIFGIKLTEYSNIPTDVENIVEEKAIKVIENGQLIIIKNGVRYSATGMRL